MLDTLRNGTTVCRLDRDPLELTKAKFFELWAIPLQDKIIERLMTAKSSFILHVNDSIREKY